MNILDESAEYLIPLSWSLYQFEMSPGAQERVGLYQASIFPAASFGGIDLLLGWDCTLVNYQNSYNDIVTIESAFTIDLEIEQLREESFELSAEVVVTDNITSDNNQIFFIITNWAFYNDENPWFYLVVAKSEKEDVSIINVGESATYTAELNVEMQPDWNLEDLYAVAVIQNWDDLEILQAAQKEFISTSANDPLAPIEISLHQNYPNPFNPSTTISFDLIEESDSNIELVIYNLKGQKVKQFFNNQLSAGKHSVVWNGKDDEGKSVTSGVYFYKLKTNNFEKTRKMLLIK
ncbi:MAG: T9SS type A sorting domain-containing protein [Candidatus Cloacimonetes bacterium]|jgi:hypothetical protein|nr:T9SS type A sorting domain-containing protein [Candidatus Cloacimonadota bacterium]MBT5419351.1 T9SS type A sorting domain-containing protein [Candidatus Cloacimonadota bacterium]